MFETETLVPGQLPLMLRIDPLVVLQSLLFGSVWLVLCLLVILSSRTFGSFDSVLVELGWGAHVKIYIQASGDGAC